MKKALIKTLSVITFIFAIAFLTVDFNTNASVPVSECANETVTALGHQVAICPSPCPWRNGHKASRWTNC